MIFITICKCINHDVDWCGVEAVKIQYNDSRSWNSIGLCFVDVNKATEYKLVLIPVCKNGRIHVC